MFFRCSSLVKLNLENFNTNKVTDIEFMFCECSSLKGLILIPKIQFIKKICFMDALMN